MKPTPKILTLLTGLAVIIVFSLGAVLLRLSSSGETATIPDLIQNTSDDAKSLQPEVPFADLTVPYLRQKKYQSTLANLEKVSETSTYTSYLTSYESDGFKVNGLLTQPKGEPPAGGWPAIIFIHGYIAPTVYRTEQRYLDHVAQLASNGFVVFKIDLRGHDQSEGNANGAYYASDYISDTLHAYAALETAEFVNPAKIGLWGHSMAGNVVLRSMAVKPTIPAAVIWAGAVYSYEDFQKYGLSDASYRPPSQTSDRQRRREELFGTHGEFSPDSEFWSQVAPTTYLNDLQGAIQLHHAIDDTVVSIQYSRDLVTRLNPTAIPHELYEYPQGGHNLTGSSFSTAMQRTVEFFKTRL